MIGYPIENGQHTMHVMVSELGGPMRIRICEGEKPGPLMKLDPEQVRYLIEVLTELSDMVTEEDE